MNATIFAAAYAIAYVVAVHGNYALFTYHPAIGEFGLGVEKGRDGPAMYWYGWLATAGVVATLSGAAAALVPATRRAWPCLSWAPAIVALAVIAWDVRGFFMR
jgi:hypothetical protein